LMIYRFNHSMYYANTEHLSQEVHELVNTAAPPLNWFCIDAVAVDDIDFSAAEALREIHKLLQEKGIHLVMADLQDDVYIELQRSGLISLLGKKAIFETTAEVIQAYSLLNPP